MQGSGILKTLVFLSGWGVAAWLLFGGHLDPISFGTPAGVEKAAPEAGEGELGKVFREWSADPSLAGALVGFCILDENGKTLFASPLAGTALCPASAFKTVTTGAALDLLGPGFRFETSLAASAAAGPGGVLDGDLVLAGSGDPTLSSEDLLKLVADASAAGLKQVNGKLIVDASAYGNAAPADDQWSWGDVGNAYGAGAYGVNVDHNRLSISFQPGAKAGDPAKFTGAAPITKDTRWINQVSTGPEGSGDQVGVYSQPYGRSITLRGTVPAGEESFSVSGAVPDPPALAAEILKGALEKAGIGVLGRDLPASKPAVKLATHQSAALPEIIDHLHFVSDNLEAQCLFLTMGRLQQKDPADVLRAYWESKGVTFAGLRLIDGSGLARATMIRPLDLALVNHIARHEAHGDRFRQSLKTYLDGSVRAKLGAMSGVKTEVGFLAMPDGRELTFALMGNGLSSTTDFWSLANRLLEAVRKLPAGTAPE